MTAPLRWEPPSPEAAREIGAVARRMRAGFDELVDHMCAAILEASPVLAADPVLAASTRASTGANMRRWIGSTMARPDAPVGADVPPEALDLAREMTRRGIDRDSLLTAYRQGQNVAWRTWMRCAQDEGLDGDALVATLDYGSRSLFGFVDGVLSALAEQMDAEREELNGGVLSRRREAVLLILDGAPISEARAGARLGYELGGDHTALVLWATDGGVVAGELERAAGVVCHAIGGGRPFTVSAGSALWAWTSSAAPEPELVRSTASELPPGIAVAVGTSSAGMNGFRDSHREAVATQRLLMRTPGGPSTMTYAEVQVASLALQDEDRARAFVAGTLGALATADPELRETVRVYLREDSSAPRAATLLHTHRNTVLKRLTRADALLPLPLAGRGLEVRLALELERWLRPAGTLAVVA
ncbi:PucR family transcriptional regulator [Patulibacter minatonensis]|uniref:PucR family transcriptional regulator n=1 Tax=Patulibacter minatonensis TaxID=298163 RepID=UPI0004B5B27F|nr:helix-turn-helix domain-containing protein [Patulibacter minatonensis]